MVINRLDLMALPIVRDIVQKAVAYTVGDLLVFPNQVPLPSFPTVYTCTLTELRMIAAH
jgi:hypothetical protein